MKNQLLLAATFIFLSFGAFAQSMDHTSADSDMDLMQYDNDYYPIIGDNSAFGYGKGNFFINTNYVSVDGGGDLFGHFFSAGVSDCFGLTFGMANLDFYNPEILYLTPEFNFRISDNVRLGVEMLGVFPAEELGEYILNPSFILSFGSNAKHISVGYGAGINSEGDFRGMAAIDGFYAVAGIRVNGRLPFTDKVGLFSKNDYSSEDGLTYFISRTGIEGRLKSFSIYGGINYFLLDFDSFGSDSSVELHLGLSYRIGG